MLCDALGTCRSLKDISFSKNNLGIDDFVETSDSDDSLMSDDGESKARRNRRLNQAEDTCMTQLIADLSHSKPEMDRLCLAHCYFHDRGMKILAAELNKSRLRYVNISWCKMTAESVPSLVKFIKDNKFLEKLLMQHNDIYEAIEQQEGSNAAMKKIIMAIKKHQSLKYLDISATKFGSQNFRLLL